MKLAFNRQTAALPQQAKVIALCLLFSISMQMCYTSAIPIWELLSRTEKLSHLYSIFGQLVSVHCKAIAPNQPTLPVNQCKRNLLTYGNEKLESFSDAQLDLLEPYQRGANELIWSAIMRDHASATLVTTRKPLHAAPASSIIILTHANEQETTTPSRAYAKNPLFDNDRQPAYTMDMDASYGPEQDKPNTTYLTGPLVFRVRPDGTPVEEDRQQPLPRDDDIEHTSSNEQRSNTKHKIASISALKQQHFSRSYIAAPVRRRFLDSGNNFNLANMFDYYYGRRRV